MTTSQVFETPQEAVQVMNAPDTNPEVRKEIFNKIVTGTLEYGVRPDDSYQEVEQEQEVTFEPNPVAESETTQEVEEPTDAPTIDPSIVAERELIAKYESQLAEEREAAKVESDQLAEQLAEAKRIKDEALKREEAQRAADEDGDHYVVPDVDTSEEIEPVVQQPQVQQNEYERAEEMRKSEVAEYKSFLNTDFGADYKTEGRMETVLDEFIDFYFEVGGGAGNDLHDAQARQLMSDIESYGVEEPSVKARLANKHVPVDFVNAFKLYKLKLAKDGKTINPRNGAVENNSAYMSGSMENTYYLMNKKELALKEKQSAMAEISEHMKRQQQTAVIMQPNQMSAHTPANPREDLTNQDIRSARIGEISQKYKVSNLHDPQLLYKITNPDDAKFVQDLQASYQNMFSR